MRSWSLAVATLFQASDAGSGSTVTVAPLRARSVAVLQPPTSASAGTSQSQDFAFTRQG
jgi:hypothetical protein